MNRHAELAGPTATHWSRGGLTAVDRCPACGSAARTHRRYARRDNEAGLPDTWCFVECAACTSLYLDPRPDAASLPAAYANYYTHETEAEIVPQDGAAGVLWSLLHGYLNRRFGLRRQPAWRLGYLVFAACEPLRLKLDYYGRHLSRARFPRAGRLLDIGCGNGDFLLRAREMGWQVAGCEPDPAAVAMCAARGLEVIQGDAFQSALDGQQFDAITLSHVIEHVDDPAALLARIRVLLKPGGWLWIATPNPAALGLRVMGAAWFELHMPFHLCLPAQAQLRRWAAGAGFEGIALLRRGAQGPGRFRLSAAIARREGLPLPAWWIRTPLFLLNDLLGTCSARWTETVLIARRPQDRADRAD